MAYNLLDINIYFGQEAAKIQKVKVGGQKKYLPISLVRTHADIFLSLKYELNQIKNGKILKFREPTP